MQILRTDPPPVKRSDRIRIKRALSGTEAQALAAIAAGTNVLGRRPTYRETARELLVHLNRDQIAAAVWRARRKGWVMVP